MFVPHVVASGNSTYWLGRTAFNCFEFARPDEYAGRYRSQSVASRRKFIGSSPAYPTRNRDIQEKLAQALNTYAASSSGRQGKGNEKKGSSTRTFFSVCVLYIVWYNIMYIYIYIILLMFWMCT